MATRTRNAVAGVTSAALGNAIAAAGLGVITARFLLPAGQGDLTLITSVIAILILILSAGTGISLRIRSLNDRPPTPDIRAYAGYSIALCPLAAIATGGIVLMLGGPSIRVAEVGAAMALGAISMVARQTTDLVQSFGRTTLAITSVGVGMVVQAVSFGTIVVLDYQSVVTALLSAVIGSVSQILFNLASVRSSQPTINPSWDLAAWKSLISQGSPTIGYGLGLVAMQRVDRLFVVSLVGPEAGGLYAVAATVSEGARIGTSAIGQLLFVKTSATHTSNEIHVLYVAGVMLQLALVVGLATSASTIVPLLFGNEYVKSVPILQGLLIAEFAMGLALMDSRIVMGLGYLKSVAALTVAAAALAIGLYAPLILSYGVDGAVIGTIAAYTFYAATLIGWRIRNWSISDEAVLR